MAEPVSEQIVAAVRTRLADFALAKRSRGIATWLPKDLTVHISQGPMVPNEEQSCPGNPPAQAYDLPVIVSGITKPSESTDIPIDTFRNRMAADIVKNATDVDLWHQWGGLAVNTEIGTAEPYEDETGGFHGVSVPFLVTFRTDENDPYTVRS